MGKKRKGHSGVFFKHICKGWLMRVNTCEAGQVLFEKWVYKGGWHHGTDTKSYAKAAVSEKCSITDAARSVTRET